MKTGRIFDTHCQCLHKDLRPLQLFAIRRDDLLVPGEAVFPDAPASALPFIVQIDMDPSGAIVFLLYGEIQACLEGTFTLACTKLSGKKRRYAAVITDSNTRAFIYLAPDEGIQKGDHVLVPWGGGTIEGICARTAQRYDSEMGLPKRSYRKVLKKVEA